MEIHDQYYGYCSHISGRGNALLKLRRIDFIKQELEAIDLLLKDETFCLLAEAEFIIKRGKKLVQDGF